MYSDLQLHRLIVLLGPVEHTCVHETTLNCQKDAFEMTSHASSHPSNNMYDPGATDSISTFDEWTDASNTFATIAISWQMNLRRNIYIYIYIYTHSFRFVWNLRTACASWKDSLVIYSAKRQHWFCNKRDYTHVTTEAMINNLPIAIDVSRYQISFLFIILVVCQWLSLWNFSRYFEYVSGTTSMQ